MKEFIEFICISEIVDIANLWFLIYFSACIKIEVGAILEVIVQVQGPTIVHAVYRPHLLVLQVI